MSSPSLVDTSVAVPLLLNSHPCHKMVASWAQGRVLGLSGHALAETYSVLTRLAGDARVEPGDAVALIDGRFQASAVLSAGGAATAHQALARAGVWGGATYDGLVALAALEHDVTLVTRDTRALATYDALGVKVEVLRTPPDV